MSVREGPDSVFDSVKERHRLIVLLGVGSAGIGLVLGLYVAYRWFVHGVGHEVIAVVSAGALLLGVQLLVLASLTSMLVTLHRELLARVDDDSK